MKKIMLVIAGLCFVAGCGSGSDRAGLAVRIAGDTANPLYIRSSTEQLPVEIKAQSDAVLPVEMKINREIITIAIVVGAMAGFMFLTSVFSYMSTRNIRKAIERKWGEG